MRVGSGGAVTALLYYLLDKGIVDAVVTAKRVKGLKGVVFVTRTKKEVPEAAGNKWSVIPFTAKLKDTTGQQGLRRIAIVGLPCQVQFLYQMKTFPLLETDFGERIHLLISLFCLGTFATESFIGLLEMQYGIKPEDVYDIKLEKDKLVIYMRQEKKELPIHEILPYMQTGCLLCPDYTGIYSDISAGISENYLGYTVLIVRTEKQRSS